MKQEEWDEWLSHQLEGHQEMPSRDLWAGIESSLADHAEPRAVPQRTRLVPLRRWAVAAVLVGLVFGGAMLFWQIEDSTPEQTLSDRQTPPEQQLSMEWAKTTVSKRKDIPKKDATSFCQFLSIFSSSQNDTCQFLSISEFATETTPETVKQKDDSPMKSEILEKKEAPQPSKVQPSTIEIIHRKQPRKTEGLLAINAYTSGSMNGWNGRNGVQMSTEKQMMFHAAARGEKDANTIYLTGYEEQQRHDQPFSLGITFSYPLTDKLSLSSGIVYTRLHSEFKSIIRNSQLTRQQNLYYLGIPLNLQYQLWHYKGLKTYLSTGVQVDWNIKTKAETDGISQEMEKDRKQWSIGGNVGLQYDLAPQLGIYVEPGIRHYFDNGSKVRNYFKDKPTDFNLQLGVRINL